MRHERSPTATVRDIAERQWGVVTLNQLREAGLGDGAVKARTAAGALIRLHRGVYAVGHSRLLPQGRRLAAVLACGSGAALSHAAAADHLDLRGSAARILDVSVPANRRSHRGVRVHRTSFEPGDVVEHEGIRTTSPTRTIIDMARRLPMGQLENLVANAQLRGLLDDRRLEGVRSRRLDAILGRGAQPIRSKHERRLLDAVRAAGLPEPEMNVWMTHGGGEEWQADMLFRRERVIVEIDDDSHKTHKAFELDRNKDAVRQAHGFATPRFTRRQIREDLAGVIALLSRIVATSDVS